MENMNIEVEEVKEVEQEIPIVKITLVKAKDGDYIAVDVRKIMTEGLSEENLRKAFNMARDVGMFMVSNYEKPQVEANEDEGM